MRNGIVVVLLASTALASEGKWTPQQVLEAGPKWVKAQGMQIPVNEALLTNVVQLPGCSGSFVSKDGLLITNHHCVAGILQEHATPEVNLIDLGYLAQDASKELKAKAYRVQVPRAFKDVTREILEGLDAKTPDLERHQKVEAVVKRVTKVCESQPAPQGAAGIRCIVAAFDGGRFFTLTEFAEYSDTRLVYAPPRGIGEFGGEIDNWMWPRHTGDFSLLRIYDTKGQPVQPRHFFKLSSKGVKPGDAVAVLGYPGVSFRMLLEPEVRERQERWYPRIEQLTYAWRTALIEESEKDPKTSVAVADDLKSLINRHKNAQGQLAGLARQKRLERAAADEARVKAFAEKKKDAAALAAHAELSKLAAERFSTWDRDFILDTAPMATRALSWPLTLARRSTEAQKPDAEREPGYQERDLTRMRERLERDQKRYSAAADRRLFAIWLDQALKLPPEQRLASIDAVFGKLDAKAREKKIDELVAKSRVFDLEQRKAMFDETPETLAARKDPLLDLGFALDKERLELKARRDTWSGANLRLRPVWRAAVIAEAGKPVAADANSTLRITFGKVQGYSPRDGVDYRAQTTLTGVQQKASNDEPFKVPERVLAAAKAQKLGRWKDAALGDVPVAFLSDCDTTGGNSGSPTIDAQGRLVGVNFDRVWENVANDFGFDPPVARNVNADARYLLWLLEEVEGAKPLVKELLGER